MIKTIQDKLKWKTKNIFLRFSSTKRICTCFRTKLASLGEITLCSTMQSPYRNAHWNVNEVKIYRLKKWDFAVLLNGKVNANQWVLRMSRYPLELYSFESYTRAQPTQRLVLQHSSAEITAIKPTILCIKSIFLSRRSFSVIEFLNTQKMNFN